MPNMKNSKLKNTNKKTAGMTNQQIEAEYRRQLAEASAERVRLAEEKVKRDKKNAAARVRRANQKFNSLDAKSKRIVIARDVLDQLALQKLVPTSGTWVDFVDGHNELTAETELQPVLNKIEKCEVCAVGAMFVCGVKRFDKLKAGDLKSFDRHNLDIRHDDVFGYLGNFFTKEQLELIETAYEMNMGACHNDDADVFMPEVNDSHVRMRLIMENIIVNNGTFKPEFQAVSRKVTTVKFITPGFVS